MRKLLAIVATAAAVVGLGVDAAHAAQPGDMELAKAGVFQADDFPAGWRATPHKKSKTDPLKCPAVEKAVSDLRNAKKTEASSDDYEQGNDQYSSSAVVFRTEDVTRRVYKVVNSRDFRRCLTKLFKDEVGKQDQLKGFDVKVEAGTVTGGSYGDESANIGLKLTVSKGSLSQDVFADIVFVRVGRALGFYAHVSDKETSTCDEFSPENCVSFTGLITSATGRLSQ